jgi:hypothetical protein
MIGANRRSDRHQSSSLASFRREGAFNTSEQVAAMGLIFALSLRVGWLAHAVLAAGRLAEARQIASKGLRPRPQTLRARP